MISKIQGILEELDGQSAFIRLDALGTDGLGMTYQVLLAAYAAARLGGQGAQAGRIGQPIVLHTLHYLESQNQGAVLIPRRVGPPRFPRVARASARRKGRKLLILRNFRVAE